MPRSGTNVFLRALDVPRADRARGLSDQVRACVTQARAIGEAGAEAPGIARVLVPLEVVRLDDVEGHGASNDQATVCIPSAP